MILNNANRFRNRSASPAEKLHKLRKQQASVRNFDVSKKRLSEEENFKRYAAIDSDMKFKIENWLKEGK
jgi:hypothetical protein